MQQLVGVLLDIDGTLVDSNDAHAQAWADVLREAGYEVSFERIRQLIGMGGDKLLPSVSGVEKDSPEGKRLSERRKVVFRERYLPDLRPTPGAHDLLVHFRSKGLKLVVASSAEGEELQALLAVCGATELVDEAASSSEVEGSKPEPDIVEAALQKMGCSASQALMLGDTPYDVEASSRAHVGSVALRSGGWNDQDLKGALAIYDTPSDLLAHYDASPFVARSEAPPAQRGV